MPDKSSDAECSTPSVMIGIDTKPDEKYFTSANAKDLNELIKSFQGAVCSSPEWMSDRQLDSMLDRLNFPREPDAVSCKEVLAGFDFMYGVGSSNIPPEMRPTFEPIGKQAYKLATDMVKSSCVNDRITRTDMKKATRARVSAFCNAEP